MNEITFSGYYKDKCTYWMIATWPIIWVVIFMTLNIPREDRWTLSTFAPQSMEAELNLSRALATIANFE